MLKKTTILGLIFSSALLTSCICGNRAGGECDCEETEYDNPYASQTEVQFILGSDWDVDADTRALPPGAGSPSEWTDGWEETKDVDCVRMFVFRRLDPAENPGVSQDEPFLLDQSNCKLLTTLADQDGMTELPGLGSHKHRVASGTIQKISGYQYRVVGVAYNTQRNLSYASIANGMNNTADNLKSVIAGGHFLAAQGEQNWFAVDYGTNLEYSDFCARLVQAQASTEKNDNSWYYYLTGGGSSAQSANQLARQIVEVPQLFYGQCQTKNTHSEIINFTGRDASNNEVNNEPIVGTLYRGMAKIELHLKVKTHSYKVGITYSHKLDWVCLTASNVYSEVGLTSYDDFLLGRNPITTDGKFVAIAGAYVLDKCDTENEAVITAYILPCRTKLRLRAYSREGSSAPYRIYNGQDFITDHFSYGGTATGVIEVDVNGSDFYFRRNHKYVLYCNDSEKLF